MYYIFYVLSISTGFSFVHWLYCYTAVTGFDLLTNRTSSNQQHSKF